MYFQFLTTAKRRFDPSKATGRIGGSSSNSVDYQYHNSFGLGADYDYEDTTQEGNSANAVTANTAGITNNGETANNAGTTTNANTANGNGQSNTAEGTNNAASTSTSDTSTSDTNTATETTNPVESTNTEEVSTTAGATGKDGAAGATNTPSTLFPEVRPSGLIIEYLSRPNVCEKTAEKGNILTMHYTGILQSDGTKFLLFLTTIPPTLLFCQ